MLTGALASLRPLHVQLYVSIRCRKNPAGWTWKSHFDAQGLVIVKQSIVHIALVIQDYDEAIDFYVNNMLS